MSSITKSVPLVLVTALLAATAPAQFLGFSTQLLDLGRQVDGRTVGTVRLYADMSDPLDKLLLWGGTTGQPMNISTSDPLGFWQHSLGFNTTPGICFLEPVFPNVRYDSWLALGFSPPSTIGIDFTGFNNGGTLFTDNGGCFQIPTQSTVCPVNGSILLAQFTVGMGESVSGTAWLAGTLSSGQAPCGTVPNGTQWQTFTSFAVTLPAVGTAGTLTGTPQALSLSSGGTQTLQLTTQDPDLQGSCLIGDSYLVVGTFAGTAPGAGALPSSGGDLLVPSITQDLYTSLTLGCPNLGLFTGFCGVLDLAGGATAGITLPAGFAPGLVGLTAHHLVVVWRPTFGFVHVSNPVPLDFVN